MSEWIWVIWTVLAWPAAAILWVAEIFFFVL